MKFNWLNVVNDQSLKCLRGPLCIWRATAHAHTHWMRISLHKCTSCLVLTSDTQALLSKSTCFLFVCSFFFFCFFLVYFYSPLSFGRCERVWALFPWFVSDLKRSKVGSKVRGYRTTHCSDPGIKV